MLLRYSFFCVWFLVGALAPHSGWGSTAFIDLDNLSKSEREEILRKEVYTDSVVFDPLINLAKDVTDILKKHGIEPRLIFGSLLAVARNDHYQQKAHGPLLWDDDVDLGVVATDIMPKEDLLKKAFKEKGYDFFPWFDHFNLENPNSKKPLEPEFIGYKVYQYDSYQLNGKRQNTFVDLFVFEPQRFSSATQPTEDRYVLKGLPARLFFERAWFKRSEFESLEQTTFADFRIAAPHDKEAYCDRMYPGWRTLALYYWRHTEVIPRKYKWTLEASHCAPALPSWMRSVEKKS